MRKLKRASNSYLRQDIKRNFKTVVELGSGAGHFSRLLEPENAQKALMLDLSGTDAACFSSADAQSSLRGKPEARQ